MARGFASMGTERLREITQAAGKKSAQMRYGEKIGSFRYALYYNKGNGPYWMVYKCRDGKTYTLHVGKNKPVDWTPFEEKLSQKMSN
jgi:hypothetical protein